MKLGSCPVDSELEAFFYKDLPFTGMLAINIHLLVCKGCRQRLAQVRNFDALLSQVPMKDPPDGFLQNLLCNVESWDFPENPEQSGAHPKLVGTPNLRSNVKWGLSTAILAIAGVLQWRFGEQVPEIIRGNYVMSFADVQNLWSVLASGEWVSNLKTIGGALRADGFTSLKIMGGAIPWLATGVIMFGGLLVASFAKKLQRPRSGGDGS